MVVTQHVGTPASLTEDNDSSRLRVIEQGDCSGAGRARRVDDVPELPVGIAAVKDRSYGHDSCSENEAMID